MYSEKSAKENNKSDGDHVSAKMFKLKSILKSREVKSCTSPRHDYISDVLTKPVKMGKSEPINLPQSAKSYIIANCPSRTAYVSPYKMSMLNQIAQPKPSTSSNNSTPRTIKSCKSRTGGKKHSKKLSTKKATKPKTDESEFQEKLHCIQNRICMQMTEIKRGLYEPIAVPDGKEDLIRRKKCEHEFWCRFTRNFISELVRQMRIFLRLAQSKPRTLSCIKLIQRRLLTLHQIVFQSLVSYLGHMPMSLSNELNSNVKFVLEQLLSVLKLCTEHKVCSNILKIQHGISTLLKFQEEDKKNLKSNYKEMKPLQSSARRTEQQKLAKRLSMYLERPGQYKMLSKSLRKSLKPKGSKKSANRMGPDPNGPIVIDPDVETLVSLQESSESDEEDDTRLQTAFFNMGNLISNAIDYKNTLKTMMSSYTDYFDSGEKSWGVVSILAIQLINEAIIDMTAWDDEHVMDEFAPLA